MATAPTRAPFLLLLALLAAPCAARGQGKSAEAEYQAGVEFYSQGRFAQADAQFRRTLRLDPSHRSARLALERLRVERASFAAPQAARAAPRPAVDAEPEDDPFDSARRLFFFEETLGNAREDAGRLQAMLGRVAQLRAERELCRARGRAFERDAELHALSRRLSAASL